ncbi:hypothetical protein A3860_08795 [Niastella vici]|uniref:Uncharacterized protein n=1 Tax=Niastella vici TaxID=1703345 RepID=A0A1V9FH66_9BACT|nr:hypothetical protein [Niastella vici]OQP57718.1 hypothetical protein A3860_08795 [Niastella vici]
MWKIIQPGDKLALGDTVKLLPSSIYSSTKKEKLYQVVKTEQHYFEIMLKPDDGDTGENAQRRIIRYLDIGYHIAVEVWEETLQTDQ